MVEPIRIERRKLFEQVASHLERQIVTGRLKSGERLPAERDLCRLFGVGRPSIREALIALEKRGLVELRNGASARVAAASPGNLVAGMAPAVQQMLLSPDGQRNFQRLRAFVETGLARHAARHATEADLERLAAALAANEAALDDVERFVATDVAFHFVFAEIMANPVFTAVHDALSTWLAEQRRVTNATPGAAATACAAHRRIYEAVRRRDPDAAEAAMAEHMAHVAAVFWQLAQAGEVSA